MAGCDYNTGVGSTKPNPATDDFIVFGYSQSAVVASLVKNDLIANPDLALDGTEIFVASNPMRANGGILARGPKGLTIPIIGITFYGPTQNSCSGEVCDPNDDFVTPDRRCRPAVRHPRRRRPRSARPTCVRELDRLLRPLAWKCSE